MAKPKKSKTPICDLIERLMSAGMSISDVLNTAKAAEAAITNARGSSTDDRHRWREQKRDQRDGRREMSAPKDSAAISTSEIDSGSDSDSKEDSAQIVRADKSRSKGAAIPDDWAPSQDDLGYGSAKLHLTPAEMDNCAEEMALWARANRNRAVARKADWNLTFKGWMRRAAPQIIRNRPRGGFNGQAASAGAGKTGFAGNAARIRNRLFGADDGRPAPEDLEPLNRR